MKKQKINALALITINLLLFGCLVLVGYMGDWDWLLRIGAIFALSILGSVFVLAGSNQRKRRKTPRRKKQAATETELVETDYELVMDRLQEFVEQVSGSEDEFESLGEKERRILYAREYSLATAISNTPNMILSEDDLAAGALIRSWRLCGFNYGGALLWESGGTGLGKIIATSGFEDIEPQVESIELNQDDANTLKNGDLLLLPPDSKQMLHPESKFCLRVPVCKQPLNWGWLQFEWTEEKDFSEHETRFLMAIGNEMASAVGLRMVWMDGRSHSKAFLDAADSAMDVTRKYKAKRGQKISSLLQLAAEKLDLSPIEIEIGTTAAYFMDLGEVGIPDLFFQLEEDLSPQERKFVAEHPHLSAKLMRQFLLLRPLEEIIISHHERWDGQGYPNGLHQEDIPQVTRLLSVCDAFEAMLSNRPHRPAKSMAEAREILEKEKGAQFDPEMVDAVLTVARAWSKDQSKSEEK
ncbi:MAG: HD domain-containing protein [Candidatus Lindowbacteria bacterium]|nr:HD domain-containing protein [Candidatus Lindowbacteria bacterium]